MQSTHLQTHAQQTLQQTPTDKPFILMNVTALIYLGQKNIMEYFSTGRKLFWTDEFWVIACVECVYNLILTLASHQKPITGAETIYTHGIHL